MIKTSKGRTKSIIEAFFSSWTPLKNLTAGNPFPLRARDAIRSYIPRSPFEQLSTQLRCASRALSKSHELVGLSDVGLQRKCWRRRSTRRVSFSPSPRPAFLLGFEGVLIWRGFRGKFFFSPSFTNASQRARLTIPTPRTRSSLPLLRPSFTSNHHPIVPLSFL